MSPKLSENQTKNPDTLCCYGTHAGGVHGAVTHTWLLIRSLSILFAASNGEALAQEAINLLLPLLPLHYFAVNCRSFKRFRLLFSQNKLSCLT